MSNVLTGALEAAQHRAADLLPMLERWVRQNSFSGDVAAVNAMGELLAEDFRIPGLTLRRVAGDGVGDHLVWNTDAWDEAAGGGVVLIGHHDTVFPPGTFEAWVHEGDRVRGPGVLDMKGGLLVVRTALAALADAGVLPALPIAVVCVGDEEIGSPDSRPLLERVARGARAALVFEAGRASDLIITQRKGTGKVTVTATGKAAHAGNHHGDGINAIRALAGFVEAAEQLTDYDAGVTVNVGLIEGGSSANTVPAQARCWIDFRFVKTPDGEQLVVALDHAARRVASDTGVKFELAGGIKRLPLERSDRSVALFEQYAACARAAGLGGDECPLIGGGSDANTVSALGVPAIDGLGPRGSGFHTHDEVIEVSSLMLRVEALIRFLVA